MRALNTRPAHGVALQASVRMLSRLRLGSSSIPIFALLSDAIAVVGASVLTGGVYHVISFGRIGSLNQFFGVGAIFAASTIGLMKVNGFYRASNVLSFRTPVAPLIIIWMAAVLFLLGIFFALKVSEALSRGWILSLATVGPVLIVWERHLLGHAMLAMLQNGGLKRRKIILITGESKAWPPADELLHLYDVERTYFLPQDADGMRTVVYRIISSVRGSDKITELHIAMDWSRWSDTRQLLSELRVLPLPVRLIPDRAAREILRCPQETLYGATTFELQRAPLTSGERAAKRAFDIAAATVGLLIMAPFLLAVALAVRIDSPGPILFRQARGGFNGRTFDILKFRTMHVMENDATVIQATPCDSRITRVGRWLRRSSVDELPQLINVLRSDMSLVGPRPHALAHDMQYAELISNYPYRHHVKPGMTGWAQVHGFRGETPIVTLMKQRVELDLWYVTKWSFWLDLRILLWTVVEICRSRNAF